MKDIQKSSKICIPTIKKNSYDEQMFIALDLDLNRKKSFGKMARLLHRPNCVAVQAIPFVYKTKTHIFEPLRAAILFSNLKLRIAKKKTVRDVRGVCLYSVHKWNFYVYFNTTKRE